MDLVNHKRTFNLFIRNPVWTGVTVLGEDRFIVDDRENAAPGNVELPIEGDQAHEPTARADLDVGSNESAAEMVEGGSNESSVDANREAEMNVGFEEPMIDADDRGWIQKSP